MLLKYSLSLQALNKGFQIIKSNYETNLVLPIFSTRR
jgi:hypothetical protein